MASDYRPFYLPGVRGRLFSLSYRPEITSTISHGVLLVPPFAEEMNKSRRMLSMQARLLADDGYLTLLPDLYGTGESEGDFQDASWDVWCDDLFRSYCWLREQGAERVSVVAERLGALLISSLICQGKVELDNLVLWQPVVSGELFLTQFLRLRVAGEMAKEAQGKSTVNQIRQELNEQGAVEIAGYGIARDLAQPLSEARLEMLSGFRGALHWCELVATAERGVTAATQKAIDNLCQQGIDVELHKVVGHPFWSATEIEEVPDLLETTRHIFSN